MSIRKLLGAAVMVVCVSFAANANINPNAIGLRFGGGSLSGAEVNYQMAMGSANRLELGLSWSTKSDKIAGSNSKYNTNYIGAFCAYQWHWNIDGGFNWYVGPGGGVGFWSWSYNVGGYKDDDSGMYLDVGGQIGIEYDFNALGAPILLSLDARPLFGLLNSSGFGWAAALGVRYTF